MQLKVGRRTLESVFQRYADWHRTVRRKDLRVFGRGFRGHRDPRRLHVQEVLGTSRAPRQAP